MSAIPGPIASAMQQAWGEVLTAAGEIVYIINRTYSGVPTTANYMEQPTLTTASGAYTAFVTNPSQRDVREEFGFYLDDYRVFHVASGAIAMQFDYIQIAGTNDFFVVTDSPSWRFSGGEIKLRIVGRRIKI